MSRRDVIGIAQTGTGKTAAFAVPILHHLFTNRRRPARKTCRVLVLSPTRELSGQILDSFRAYGRHVGTSVALVIVGVSMGAQVRAVQSGVDVLVATPGRLLVLLTSNALRLGEVEFLVLDEADRMLDMGFIHDIRKIVAKLPAQRQTLLFSATMPRAIATLADQMLHDPAKVAVTLVASTVDRVEPSSASIGRRNRRSSPKFCSASRSAACLCSPAPSTAPTKWCAASPRQGSQPTPSTATSRRTSANACSPHFARGTCSRWSPPTLQRAVSMSTASATS